MFMYESRPPAPKIRFAPLLKKKNKNSNQETRRLQCDLLTRDTVALGEEKYAGMGPQM